MPRKVNCKRYVTRLAACADEFDAQALAVDYVVANFSKVERAFIQELGCPLDERLSRSLLASVVFCALGPALGVKRRRYSDDLLIVSVRGILLEAGISVSLTETPAADVKVDRPFARCLCAILLALPASSRTSPGALIERAQGWRSKPVDQLRLMHTLDEQAEQMLQTVSLYRRRSSDQSAEKMRELARRTIAVGKVLQDDWFDNAVKKILGKKAVKELGWTI